MGSKILKIASYLPEKILSNDELVKTFNRWESEKIEKKGIIYLENFKIIMFAATIKAPPIIVNIESALKNIIVFIVAIIGSKYDNITMFPPLSFLTPTL